MSGTKGSQSRSGLRTVKRDFSENTSDKGTREDPVTIEWSPSPPPVKPQVVSNRMRAIQEALASCSSAKVAQPLEESKKANKKRPSDSTTLFDDEVRGPASKKKRELPETWKEGNASSAHAGSSGKTANRAKVIELSNSTTIGRKSKKIPGVFLSQEQSQILNLVKQGMSVFYTGSAGTGKSVLLREIIKSLRIKHGKAPDAVAITASTGRHLFPLLSWVIMKSKR
ncbi:hypothetical protein L218DRAFT_424224 [Marasmius fiardii PR-910]|nr:hypothetical protein L218DRAFT_424224 [Marasmius fiardii PR-910]